MVLGLLGLADERSLRDDLAGLLVGLPDDRVHTLLEFACFLAEDHRLAHHLVGARDDRDVLLPLLRHEAALDVDARDRLRDLVGRTGLRERVGVAELAVDSLVGGHDDLREREVRALLACLHLVDHLVEFQLHLAERAGDGEHLDEVPVVVRHLDGVEELTAGADHGVGLHDDVAEVARLERFELLLLGGDVVGDDDAGDSGRCEVLTGLGGSGEDAVRGDDDTEVRAPCLHVADHAVDILGLQLRAGGRHEGDHILTVGTLVEEEFTHYTAGDISQFRNSNFNNHFNTSQNLRTR